MHDVGKRRFQGFAAPTRTPSMFFHSHQLRGYFPVTLPPYKMRILFDKAPKETPAVSG
jgi:hypothetical protein